MKTAIITGASGGIGNAITTSFYNKGYNLVLTYKSNKNKLDAITKDFDENRFVAIQCDLGLPDDIENLMQNASKAYSSIDVIVNNAGIPIIGRIADVSLEDFDKAFVVNTRSVFHIMKKAFSSISDNGSIVNISSVLSQNGDEMGAVYGASKAAVNQMTKVAAKEFSSKRVNVNAILPGSTSPGMFDNMPEDAKEHYAKEIPIGRVAKAAEIAAMALHLAGPLGKSINGELIVIDGGLNA